MPHVDNTSEYQIQLPCFAGPFDLLLHLIRENQVDIYDIPIAEIAEQYLSYLQQMREMDLEIASSFLVMAATLLAIKARLLLPKPTDAEGGEAEDARADLVHDLLEYMRIKEAAGGLAGLRAKSEQRLARPNEEELYVNLFQAVNPLSGKTLADLQNAFQLVLHKAEARGEIVTIVRDQVTLRDCMDALIARVQAQPKGIAFSEAFAACLGKMELIVTFLALLELIRQQVIRVQQSHVFGEIYLYAGDLENYDRNAAI